MATVTKTQYTPEDLLAIDDRPMPELVDGELVEREMGQQADAIAANIGRMVGNFVAEHKSGLCNGAQGSYQIFPDDPKKVRIPDVSFTRRERLPNGGGAAGHARIAPDFVVEVVSPNDNAEELHQKIRDFLAVGIPLIWMVFRPDGSAKSFEVGEVLEGEDILPGFRLEVAAIFEEM
jgi:Uma2 family endonuclease